MDFMEDVGKLGTFIGDDMADSAGSDDQNGIHVGWIDQK